MEGTVVAVCVSDVRGVQKRGVERVRLVEGFGIENDAHAGDWHRQVSLLSRQKIDDFNGRGGNVDDGDFGENVIVDGVDLAALPVGTRLAVGDALLEVTQIGKECHQHCQIFHRVGDCIMPREGIFAKVLEGGTVGAGDRVEVLRGQYTVNFENVDIMQELCDRNEVDLILTTGGTGLSDRDCMPEATIDVAHKLVPGIPEAMRAHSIQKTSHAMLSRGVAAIRKQPLIVNLPGSPKAASENLECILPALVHGLDILTGKANECAATGTGVASVVAGT